MSDTEGRSEWRYCVVEIIRSPKVSRLGFVNHRSPGLVRSRVPCRDRKVHLHLRCGVHTRETFETQVIGIVLSEHGVLMGRTEYACHGWIAASRKEWRRASNERRTGYYTPTRRQRLGQHGISNADLFSKKRLSKIARVALDCKMALNKMV